MSDGNDTDGSGLYGKYYVEKDGEPVTECFVLEPRGDAAARAAIQAYADETDDDELARDLRSWVDELDPVD